MPTFMMILLMLLGLFMMLIVLIQRGRGGGLAGAFGGMGGQSAFGTKAGDVFTKITVVVAVLWVLLAGGSGIILRKDAQSRFTGGDRAEDGVLDVRDASGESELDTSAANNGAPLFGDDLLNTTDGNSNTVPASAGSGYEMPDAETQAPIAPDTEKPDAAETDGPGDTDSGAASSGSDEDTRDP